MSPPIPDAGALAVRRSRLVEGEQLTAVVIQVDATGDPGGLAVLQAGLHEPPAGRRLVFGYDVAAAGLGAWVGDRRVRITVWPALVDADGVITTAEDDQIDLLVIDFDPDADRAALEDLARVGRLVIAGPDAGPIPLVVDVDRQLVAQVTAACRR